MTSNGATGAARFADFDAARAEHAVQPLRLRLFGRMWELPGTLSLKTVADLRYAEQLWAEWAQRVEASGKKPTDPDVEDEVPFSAEFEEWQAQFNEEQHHRAVLGSDNYDALMAYDGTDPEHPDWKMDKPLLQALIHWAIAQHDGATVDPSSLLGNFVALTPAALAAMESETQTPAPKEKTADAKKKAGGGGSSGRRGSARGRTSSRAGGRSKQTSSASTGST